MVMQTVFRRRALLTGKSEYVKSLQDLLAQPALRERWEGMTADNVGQARYLLQHRGFDAILISDHLHEPALHGLAHHQGVPLVLLGKSRPECLTRAYREGVTMCLPHAMTLRHPPLLAAALDRAAQLADDQRRHRDTRQQLEESRRQLERLVSLIWRSTPVAAEQRWLGERFALERLDEEIARCERHGAPLTLAIGAVLGGEECDEAVSEWTSETIAQAKRRCDVAGQYGPGGFMLLMVQTPKAGGVTCCRRLQKLLHNGQAHADRLPGQPLQTCFGLASLNGKNGTSQSLLRRAEENLENARAGGKENIVAS
jgi:diguanylate cyclase (GGDEF)-like protein